MIKSFGDKRTEQIFHEKNVRNFDTKLAKKALNKLRFIDVAGQIDDLKVPPSNRLEKKTGDLKDYYAIWINTQWRIIFKWKSGHAYDVEIIDYH